jgi:general secretion pathway protein C
MLKRYFLLAYLLVVALIAALGADMVTSYISAKLTMPVSLKPAQVSGAADRPTPMAPADYAIIAERNIFNANPPKEAPEPPKEPSPPVQQEIQATQLQLKLVGIAAGADDQAYAIIEDLTKRGTQALYQVGDTIQNVVIAEIRSTCVLFNRGGQYEVLCFQHDGVETKGPQSRQPPPPPVTSQSQDDGGIVRVDGATWRVNRELLMEQFGNFGNLSAQARFMPYAVQGQPQGFQLVRLVPGSFLQKIGLQNGDVLQRVNGLSINSAAEALQAFQQLQNEATVRLEVLRQSDKTVQPLSPTKCVNEKALLLT